MKDLFRVSKSLCPGLAALFISVGPLVAQTSPEFAPVQRLTNNEMVLKLSTSNGFYRIDAATNLAGWNGLLTLLNTNGSVNQYTDSAAPFLSSRIYRAQSLEGTNFLTGDHLATTNGDVVIHPMNHASFSMSWNGKIIYNDPTNRTGNLPRGDLILVTHAHSDHFDATALANLRQTNGIIIAPQAVYNSLSAVLKTNTIVLANGALTNVLGISVQAVPSYNITPANTNFHPKGVGNGYVLTIADKRLYVSGDSEDTPEMRALQNIDVAFLNMNQPYTMNLSQAVSAVRAFRPQIVYPNHFQNQGGTFTDLNSFKQQVRTNPVVEVRIRKWY
jgi:L-ascorbate metabolism protein UlaG (beta-lactamase superfamily)